MINVTLSSGYKMPILGLGTWQSTGSQCYTAVIEALEMGYTHIDTAIMYHNESEIGKAIRDIKKDRSQLFITTKVWLEHLRYNQVIEQTYNSLKRLQTDYVDLLLIHWPNKQIPMSETFNAFSKLVSDKMVRSVGVSNFNTQYLEKALKETTIPISVNQVEYHPFLNQNELFLYCKENKITITAYSPLARGKVLESGILKKIARKNGCSISQVVLSWLMSKGIVVIPKATSKKHLRENYDSQNVKLSEEDTLEINQLDSGTRIIEPSWSDF